MVQVKERMQLRKDGGSATHSSGNGEWLPEKMLALYQGGRYRQKITPPDRSTI
jgi:hypothetical protein